MPIKIKEEIEASKPSVTEELIVIAKSVYEIVKTKENNFLAYPCSGPKIAKGLAGSQNALSEDLLSRYYKLRKKVARDSQITDAIRILQSEARAKDPIRAHIRYAQVDDNIYVDLGDATGRAVHITAEGWKIIERPPVYFRRTALINPLPEPARGGHLEEIFSILNIPESHRSLFKGFLVASCFENIPHPLLVLDGEQGCGKSKTAGYTHLLLDPSAAVLRTPPRDEAAWIEAAQGCYVVSLDNLSNISNALSDALCRSSTGAAHSKRQLFSDSDSIVYAFRSVVILNGINLSDTRDDLNDRLLTIQLPVIPANQRRYEKDLQAIWDAQYPLLLGALYDLCALVIKEMPNTDLKELPRMADFARILATIDRIEGGNSFHDYLVSISKSAENIVDSDPFLKSLEAYIEATWIGSASELLSELNKTSMHIYEKGWPDNPKAVTDKLRRSAPTLRKAGWEITDLDSTNHKKVIKWRITPPAGSAGSTFTFLEKEKEEGAVENLVGSENFPPRSPHFDSTGMAIND